MSKFLQDLSEMCELLRRLTHKGAEWIWGHEQEVAFERVKEAVVKAPVLTYFNESEPNAKEMRPRADCLTAAVLRVSYTQILSKGLV